MNNSIFPGPADAETPGGRFLAAYTAADTATALDLIERHWSVLIFNPVLTQPVFDVVGAASITELAHRPRASLLAEIVGGLAHGSTRVDLPSGPGQIQQVIRAGSGRTTLEIAILAMVAERVHRRADSAMEIATTTRPLLQAISATRFSPATELVAYWHLQAAQAAFHAGDLERARLDFEHAWTHRHTDVTAYVAPSTAPFGVLIAALQGDHHELARWQRHWATLSEQAATMIDATTMARPAHIADLLTATDHLEDDVASHLVDLLEPQLPYDELWPVTLWAMVRHLINVGAVVRARSLVASATDTHPAPPTGRSLQRSFVALAQAEVALAEGRLPAILPLLERSRPAVIPGLDGLYAVCAHVAAGDLAEARRHAVITERSAVHPRVLREVRYFIALCDHADESPNPDAVGFDPDLRRVVAHLPADFHPTATGMSGVRIPASRVGSFDASTMITLTPAEHRVLRALEGPGTLSDVAADLQVTRNTLKTQVRGLYRKLSSSSRDEAIARARRHGLLDSEA